MKSEDKKENEKKEYGTTNFHIGSWLIMNGHKPLRANWADRERCEFVFEDFEGREELVNNFFKDETTQKKIAADQELKQLMYANRPPRAYARNN
jgi:hypothetical protein